MYIGINGIARKIKSIYIGVGNVARKGLKGYVGVNEVAKQFWTLNEKTVKYYGTIEDLSSVHWNMNTSKIENYAIFAGGKNSSTAFSTVCAFDENLNKLTATSLTTARNRIVGTNLNGNAIFAGGTRSTADFNPSYTVNTVEKYDKDLVKSTLTNMTTKRAVCTGGKFNGSAYFCGGINGSAGLDSVEAYDSDFVHSNPITLSTQRAWTKSASSTNYLLIFGGTNGNSTTKLSSIDAFDANLTRSSPTPMNENLCNPGVAVFQGNLIRIGGEISSGSSNIVEIYDGDSLVKGANLTLPITQHQVSNFTPISNDGEFLFVCGGKTIMSVFDKDMVRTDYNMDYERNGHTAESVGNYIIIRGGTSTNNLKAEIFKIV